ncbi:hypothetical protein Taro_004247 [Colocasia esculenta]|uniref:Uncharacterized protein n=1 Tax=Colocasia esculenta TaxID=4460 RepID=A0A843TLX4_COLES|nr:hypothetical protein [Colocasia esculenta]
MVVSLCLCDEDNSVLFTCGPDTLTWKRSIVPFDLFTSVLFCESCFI